MKKYLITSALPYANGPIHFGHFAGAYLPGDMFTRHHRLLGHKCKHICGSDEHGVAIMLNAKKEGKDYKEYVDGWHKNHAELFKRMEVDFDFFGQTSADYHAEEVKTWFDKLNDKGLIGTKDNQQLYCNDCNNHLPDRFVEGTCYSCASTGARGDECPDCGILIDSVKLKDPICKICGSRNIKEVTVTQYYLLLSKYHKEFREWFETKEGFWRKTVYPFVDSLTREGLHDRAISRDLDWGIDVPLPEAKGKKLYVWFDAPIGYVSNLKQHLKETGSLEHYLDDWFKSDDVELTHFLAKDNIIFHTIIFPVMGMASGVINPPYDVPANQYLNLEGKQFSKSRGWYVDLDQAISDFGSDALRYYLISILPENSDSSFSWSDFQAKINGELANNVGNLVNRCLKFFHKNWNEGLEAEYFSDFDKEKFQKHILEHKSLLDSKQFKKGLEKVMSISAEVNTFFSDLAPWAQIKDDEEAAKKTIALTSEMIFILGILLRPYLPILSSKILSLYRDILSDGNMKEIYSGNLDVLERVFVSGLKINGTPDALVPKIEDSKIKDLNEKLHSMES